MSSSSFVESIRDKKSYDLTPNINEILKNFLATDSNTKKVLKVFLKALP
jgi:hypothetical protein